MKKTFRYYGICWLIALAVFNVITFLIPNGTAGINKFTDSFWVGYIFITAAFIGQLGCAFKAFGAGDTQKFFYSIPLVTISYAGLAAMLTAGSVCMAVPTVPHWAGIIVCLLVLAFYAVSVIKASAAAGLVSKTDEKIKTQTQFIKLLATDAEHLMVSAATAELKAEAKKVYEAIRYSDPMSNDALKDIEGQIQSEFTFFSQAVKSEDLELACSVAKELLNFIDGRNKKCKTLK